MALPSPRMRGSEIHAHIACSRCHVEPVLGPCFRSAAARRSYLCGACHGDVAVTEQAAWARVTITATAAHEAAASGDVATLAKLPSQLIDTLSAPYQLHPLHVAAFHDQAAAIACLLQHRKCRIDVRSASGDTPLHMASAAGALAAMDLLLAANADPNSRSRLGYTAVHSAVKHGSLAALQRLVIGPSDMATAACASALSSCFQCPSELLPGRYTADLYAETRAKMSVLRLACISGMPHIAKWLLDRGVRAEPQRLDIHYHKRRDEHHLIPPELWTLRQATFLCFDWLGLTSVPNQIGDLTNLTGLRLSNNQLTSLTPRIGRLTNLTDLVLYNNQLSYLPVDILNLKRCKHIRGLVNNAAHDIQHGWVRVPEPAARLSLRDLAYQACARHDIALVDVPTDLVEAEPVFDTCFHCRVPGYTAAPVRVVCQDPCNDGRADGPLLEVLLHWPCYLARLRFWTDAAAQPRAGAQTHAV